MIKALNRNNKVYCEVNGKPLDVAAELLTILIILLRISRKYSTPYLLSRNQDCMNQLKGQIQIRLNLFT